VVADPPEARSGTQLESGPFIDPPIADFEPHCENFASPAMSGKSSWRRRLLVSAPSARRLSGNRNSSASAARLGGDT